MVKQNYIMSFTTGGLFLNESLKILRVYLELADWDKTKETTLSENLLQTRTVSATKRICREVIFRLQMLNENEIKLLSDGDRQDQVQVLWLAVCRRYKLIKEFMVEVVREKYLGLEYNLIFEDYDKFYNRKAEWSDQLASQTEATKKKQRQVLFRMLQEAEILTKANIISPQLFSARFVDVMSNSMGELADVFPSSGGAAKQGVA